MMKIQYRYMPLVQWWSTIQCGHRFDPAVALKRDTQTASSVRCLALTYRNRLQDANLLARRRVLRQPVTPRHRAARLEFA